MKIFLRKLFYLVALLAVSAIGVAGVVMMFALPGFVFLRGHETLKMTLLVIALGIPLTIFAVSDRPNPV